MIKRNIIDFVERKRSKEAKDIFNKSVQQFVFDVLWGDITECQSFLYPDGLIEDEN